MRGTWWRADTGPTFKGLKVWIGKQEGRKGVGTFSPTDGQSWSLGWPGQSAASPSMNRASLRRARASSCVAESAHRMSESTHCLREQRLYSDSRMDESGEAAIPGRIPQQAGVSGVEPVLYGLHVLTQTTFGQDCFCLLLFSPIPGQHWA